MVSVLILWSHALAALLFGALALSQVSRAATGLPRMAFLVALTMTALWALAIAGIGEGDLTSKLAETGRNIAWLAFMVALLGHDRRAPVAPTVIIVYGTTGVIALLGFVLAFFAGIRLPAAELAAIAEVAIIMRMLVAATAMVLVYNLYRAVAPSARGGIWLAVMALAAMWALDLGVYTLRYLGVIWVPSLVLMRGTGIVLLAPLFALAAHRNGNWSLYLSRTVAYRSMSGAAILLYVVAMVLVTSALGNVGSGYARMLQTAFVFGSTTAMVTILSTPSLPAWIKVKLAKHFFTHRYDYRAEWLRFTETLGQPGDGAAPLQQRIVKAVADLTDSPGGLLLVPDGGALGAGAAWNWESQAAPSHSDAAKLAGYLEATGRIVELDAVRSGTADAAEMGTVPIWMLDRPEAWVLVPLVHFGKLTGAILLARPAFDRQPDWEDLDLLRLAGRQVASYLAEARAHEALSEAARFDEFNRRFAFIMHDIKNLVSQLSLVARNAERHADNPAFRADMVATLQDSATRMNELLSRLSQHNSMRPSMPCPVEIVPLIERIALARRAQHAVFVGGLAQAWAVADPARVEQLLGHLLQNAIDASPPGEPIAILVNREGEMIVIDVVDHGCGMDPAFVRDRLFKPFVSSKPGGFGLGAFEARQLAEAMGGGVDVFSREGEGTRFRVTLPAAAATAASLEQAA